MGKRRQYRFTLRNSKRLPECHQPLQPYNPATIANMSAPELQRAIANFATVELRDGVNTNAMQTVGNIRANAPLVQTKISNLEQDSLSNDPSLNTEVGVLNKIGSVAESVGKKGRGKRRYVEKSRSGTFPLRLEIPQRRRDSHFSHRPGYDG